MTFKDIFQSSFLERTSSFAAVDFVIAMVLAFAMGLFIFWVYKKTFSGVMYSAGFGVSLMAMTMITTLVILAVTSNVVLSLGMVGALSIVRFRTAVKEPMDIAFLFWAIAAGIVLGAGLVPLAVFGSLFIGGVLWLFINRKTNERPYIMIVSCGDQEAEKKAFDIIQENVKKQVLKSKTVSKDGIELTLEVCLKGDDLEFINKVSEIENIENAVLVSYNGDYMS